MRRSGPASLASWRNTPPTRYPFAGIRNPHVVHNLPLAARRGVGHTDRSRRRGRVAEGGGLLNRYRVVKPYRGFESLRLRHPLVTRALSILVPPANRAHWPANEATRSGTIFTWPDRPSPANSRHNRRRRVA